MSETLRDFGDLRKSCVGRIRQSSSSEQALDRIDHELHLLKVFRQEETFLNMVRWHRKATATAIPLRLIGAGVCSYLGYLLELNEIDPLEFHLPAERALGSRNLQFTFQAEKIDLAPLQSSRDDFQIPPQSLSLQVADPVQQISWEVNSEILRGDFWDFDLAAIPRNDSKVWKSICDDEDETLSLVTPSTKEFVREFEPQSLLELAIVSGLDLIDLTAPEQVEEYRRRRKTNLLTRPYGSVVAGMLRPTQGMLLFQEQILNLLTGLTRLHPWEPQQILQKSARGDGGEIEQGRFLAEARPNLLRTEHAEDLFEEIQMAARFAPCLGHLLAMALVTYQTAYLRVHFPREIARVIERLPSH